MAQWQPVVDFGEQLRHLRRILGFDLALEAVHLVHSLAFVVTTSHEKMIRVQQLEAKEGKDALNRKRTTVDEVAVE